MQSNDESYKVFWYHIDDLSDELDKFECYLKPEKLLKLKSNLPPILPDFEELKNCI